VAVAGMASFAVVVVDSWGLLEGTIGRNALNSASDNLGG
jgi:hypothetical protein